MWGLIMPAHKIDLLLRFNSKYTTIPITGCWLWTGNSNGRYGKMKINGKFISSHRVSYTLFKGDPGTSLVLHKCDTSMCVNPNHLYLGDNSSNQKDRFERSKKYTRDSLGRFCGS